MSSHDRFEIRGGTAVLPDGQIENARIVIEGDRIVDVAESPIGFAPGLSRVDASGCFVLPGAVDAHGDGLEQQIRPRPLAEMPLDLAVHACDRLLASAGVTTTFHAVKFSDDPGRERTLGQAGEIVDSLRAYQSSGERLVEHFVLHRLDVRMPGSWEALSPHLGAAEVPYVSIDDNQPGQGQFRDLDSYAERLRPRLDALGMTVEEYFESQMKDDSQVVASNERSLSKAIESGAVRAASHDDDSPEQVRSRRDLGCTIAEFPVTEEAAREARELGMPVVVGAPNALRGASTASNVSVRRLLDLELVSVLCSDYSPWSLWWAVFRLASEGCSSLERLARTVSLDPARTVGIDGDRGALAPGLRADLVVLNLHRSVPKVEAVFARGRLVYNSGRSEGLLSRQEDSREWNGASQ